MGGPQYQLGFWRETKPTGAPGKCEAICGGDWLTQCWARRPDTICHRRAGERGSLSPGGKACGAGALTPAGRGRGTSLLKAGEGTPLPFTCLSRPGPRGIPGAQPRQERPPAWPPSPGRSQAHSEMARQCPASVRPMSWTRTTHPRTSPPPGELVRRLDFSSKLMQMLFTAVFRELLPSSTFWVGTGQGQGVGGGFRGWRPRRPCAPGLGGREEGRLFPAPLCLVYPVLIMFHSFFNRFLFFSIFFLFSYLFLFLVFTEAPFLSVSSSPHPLLPVPTFEHTVTVGFMCQLI